MGVDVNRAGDGTRPAATASRDGCIALPSQTTTAPDSGRIVRLCTGQCHGTIRMADGRDVWFHRSDMAERATFNDFRVGDSVMFELREDRISGARALRVRRRPAHPRKSAT